MYKLFLRPVDQGKNDYIYQKDVDLDSSIAYFETFDWEVYFAEIKKRTLYKLTSTSPAIIIQQEDQERTLIIKKDDLGNVSIDYNERNKSNSIYIHANATITSEVENVPSIITRFFKNQIESFEDENVEFYNFPDAIGKYNLLKYWAFFVRLPIAVILTLILFINGNNDVVYVGLFFIVVLVIGDIPPLIAIYQYILQGKLECIKFNKEEKYITLCFAHGNKRIDRKDIKKCVYNYSPDGKYNLFMANLVLQLKNREQFAITSITIDETEFNVLINFLDVHYYRLEKGTSFISITTPDGKIEIDKSLEADESHLKGLYSNYTNEQLKEILANKENYQEKAILVAEHELKYRK